MGPGRPARAEVPRVVQVGARVVPMARVAVQAVPLAPVQAVPAVLIATVRAVPTARAVVRGVPTAPAVLCAGQAARWVRVPPRSERALAPGAHCSGARVGTSPVAPVAVPRSAGWTPEPGWTARVWSTAIDPSAQGLRQGPRRTARVWSMATGSSSPGRQGPDWKARVWSMAVDPSVQSYRRGPGRTARVWSTVADSTSRGSRQEGAGSANQADRYQGSTRSSAARANRSVAHRVPEWSRCANPLARRKSRPRVRRAVPVRRCRPGCRRACRSCSSPARLPGAMPRPPSGR